MKKIIIMMMLIASSASAYSGENGIIEDNDTLGNLVTCTIGYSVYWTGSIWDCSPSPSLPACTANYYVKSDGTSWGCVDAATDFVNVTGDTMTGVLDMGNNAITNIDWLNSDDGTDSGLDADLLDGQQGAYYMPSSTDNWVNTSGDTMSGALDMGNNAITNIDWSTSDDGTGSGLDADLLDGQHGAYYMPASYDTLESLAGDCTSDYYVQYKGSSWTCTSVSVSDVYVNTTGDTMTGPLSLIYADSAVSTPFINIGNTTPMGSGTMVKIEYSAGASASNRYGLWIDGNSSDTDNYILYLQGSTNIWNMNGAGTVNHINGNYNLSNVLYDAAGPVELGTAATTGHSLSTGDVIVGGALEVDGNVYFDSPVAAATIQATQLAIGNSSSFILGDATTGSRLLATATQDQFLLGVGSDHGNHFVFTTRANIGKDHGYAAPTNPTVTIWSANDKTTPDNEYGALYHDGGSFYIDTGVGKVSFLDSIHVKGQLTHYGAMHIYNNSTATTVSSSNTWYELDDGFTDGDYLDGFSFNMSDPSLVSTCTNDGNNYRIHYDISSSSAGTNQVIQISIFKNGVILPLCTSERKYSTATDVGNSGWTCNTTINNGDVIKIKVNNTTGANDFTAKYGVIEIQQI